jgi:hypothetical protein
VSEEAEGKASRKAGWELPSHTQWGAFKAHYLVDGDSLCGLVKDTYTPNVPTQERQPPRSACCGLCLRALERQAERREVTG